MQPTDFHTSRIPATVVTRQYVLPIIIIVLHTVCKISPNQANPLGSTAIELAELGENSDGQEFKRKAVDKTYGVIIDCGSSGSRVHIYQWDNSLSYSELLHDVEPMRHPNGTTVTMKLKKRLSEYDDKPEKIPGYFQTLMDFISEYIPEERHPYTGIYVMATAGMRLLPDEDQKTIMDKAREYIEDAYNFALVRTYVISGAQEGMYQWISVNSKEKRFLSPETDTKTKTFAIVEMGGASIQVTYQLRPGLKETIFHSLTTRRAKAAYLGQIIQPQMSRQEQIQHNYTLHSTTFLGFGSNSARDLLTDLLVKKHQAWKKSFSSRARKFFKSLFPNEDHHTDTNHMTIHDPCLPKDHEEEVSKPRKMLSTKSQTIGFLHEENEPSFTVKLKGTGDYLKCKKNVVKVLELAKRELLNCKLNENDQCTMSLIGEKFVPFTTGVHLEFRAIGDFYHTTNIMLDAAGQYDHNYVVAKTKHICNQSKKQLEEAFPEVIENKNSEDRIWTECFKAVWVDTFLTKAIKMPKDYKFLKTVDKIGPNKRDEPEWPLGAVLDKSLAIEKAAEDGSDEEVENRNRLNPESRSGSLRGNRVD